MMLIDEFMQTYDVTERHEIRVHAPAQQVYDTMRTTNVFSSPIVRGLFFLRELPARLRSSSAPPRRFEVSVNTLLKSGFILLGEDPPREFLIGSIECVGAASSDTPPWSSPEKFRNFNAPGFIKMIMNLSLAQQPDGTTRLASETRVLCLDDASRRRFRLYWLFIGPFSAWIRRLMLRAMKREAEMA